MTDCLDDEYSYEEWLEDTYRRDDDLDCCDDNDAEYVRGTSQCDGMCDPQCLWCLVAHSCPGDCAGGKCPYDELTKRERRKPYPATPSAEDEIDF